MGAVLSIAGAVLKVLLTVILVLVLLLLFVLFCPAAYRAKADYHGELTAEGRVLWLCGLVCLSFSFREGRAESRFRLFGLDMKKILAGFAGREEKGADRQEGGEKTADLQAAELGGEWPGGEPGQMAGEAAERPGDGEPKSAEGGAVGDAGAPESAGSGALRDVEAPERADSGAFRNNGAPESPGGREPDRSGGTQGDRAGRGASGVSDRRLTVFFRRLWERMAGLARAVRQFFLSLRAVWDKVMEKGEWAAGARVFWRSENTRRMVCILKDNVLHLWRKLKPRVLRGNIVFGTGDPCTTGQILGAAALLYAYYGSGIEIVPDFERARLEAMLFVRGRISLFTILVILIRIFLCDEWKQFSREAKQLKEAL